MLSAKWLSPLPPLFLFSPLTPGTPYFIDSLSILDDIVAVNVPLTCETLIAAYARGIFPWPVPNMPLMWFSPQRRAIIDWESVHWPQSFLKWRRRHQYRLSFNLAFKEVMLKCAAVPRRDGGGTWITPKMMEVYGELNQLGRAHSLECWNQKDQLVGGIYGVMAGRYFSAESMFHLENYTSRLCLFELCEYLKMSGHSFLDIQMITPATRCYHPREMSRQEFLALI